MKGKKERKSGLAVVVKKGTRYFASSERVVRQRSGVNFLTSYFFFVHETNFLAFWKHMSSTFNKPHSYCNPYNSHAFYKVPILGTHID
jgi:hypothetical protein